MTDSNTPPDTAARIRDLTIENARLSAAYSRATAAAKLHAHRSLALEKRLDLIETSEAFRLGAALIQGFKKPKLLPRTLATVWSLFKDARSGRANLADDHGLDVREQTGLPGRALAALYEQRGIEAVIERIGDISRGERREIRAALLADARKLGAEGYPEAEFQLIQAATDVDPSDASLRALHWTAQRNGDVVTAYDCVRRIERIYGETPSPAQEVYLEKLRRGPAYQLSLLDQVPDQPVRPVKPVADRICYVLHNSLPYSSGGYATRAHGLVDGLRRQGLDIVALTRPGFPLDIKHELTAADVPLHQVVDGLSYRHVLSPLRTGLSALDYMTRAADSLTAELEQIRPEAVLAASNHLTGLPALIAARRLGLPFFYEVRGFWEITRISREPEFEQSSSFLVQRELEAELAKRSDHVFTLTLPMEQELISRGVHPDQITILPNSCEPERFRPRDRDPALAARLDIPADVPVIGYVGTFVQYEGLELLVAAAAALKEQGVAFRLLLVGNEHASAQGTGPITEAIRHIAADRGLDKWLIMPGRVPHEQVEAYYSLIDIAPFPRKAQPVTELVSPMKPLEAYAMEKAVVVSSVGALLEMVEHERTGLVFEKDSVESLTQVLARLIADPELRGRLGREGRRWVETERTWDATARRAAERIRRTLSERTAPAMAAAAHLPV